MHTIGDGTETSAWDDKWLTIGHLAQKITPRMIHAMDLSTESKVADLLPRLNSGWPNQWVQHWSRLQNMAIPNAMHGVNDRIEWVDMNNKLHTFMMAKVWETMDGPYEKVTWYDVCWFRHHIPKHGFCFWLALQERLPTQDRIQRWRNDALPVFCPLCQTCMDSHCHLFFACAYSNQIWKDVKTLFNLPIPNSWDSILDDIRHKRWILRTLRQKLLFQATVYCIWKERNTRIFSNMRRSEDLVVKDILRVVDMRLKDRRIHTTIID